MTILPGKFYFTMDSAKIKPTSSDLYEQARRLLWWEVRVGQVTFRDLCSSWGGGSKVKGGNNAGAVPVAKTLLSGSASGVQGREWAYGWDTSGTAARCV